MAIQLLPSVYARGFRESTRWASYDATPAELDTNNPLTRGLVNAYIPSVQHNLVTGVPITSQEQSYKIRPYGGRLAFTADAADTSHTIFYFDDVLNERGLPTTSAEYTFLFQHFVTDSTTTDAEVQIKSLSGGPNKTVAHSLHSTGNMEVRYGGSDGTTQLDNNNIVDYGLYRTIYADTHGWITQGNRFSADKGVIDVGVSLANGWMKFGTGESILGTITQVAVNNYDLQLRMLNPSAGRHGYSAVYLWDRYLDDREWEEVLRHPGSLLRPVRAPVYFLPQALPPPATETVMAYLFSENSQPFNKVPNAVFDASLGGNVTLSDRSLHVTVNAKYRGILAQGPKRYGKFLVEVQTGATVTANGCGVGLCLSSEPVDTGGANDYCGGSNSTGFMCYYKNFGVYEDGAELSSTPNVTTGESFVMAVDLFTNGKCQVHFVQNNDATIETTIEPASFVWGDEVYLIAAGSSGDEIIVNTGDTPLINQHIDTLFPDYVKGWPVRDQVKKEAVYFRSQQAPPPPPVATELVTSYLSKRYVSDFRRPNVKPLGRVEVDWTHPRSNELQGAWILNNAHTWRDLVGDHHGTPEGGANAPELIPRGGTVGYNQTVTATTDTISDHDRVALGTKQANERIGGNVTGTLSIVARVNKANNTPNYSRIIDAADGADGTNGWAAYASNTGTGTIHFTVNGNDRCLWSSNGEMPLDQSVLVVITYDDSDINNSHIWVDGVEVSYAFTKEATAFPAAAVPLTIGNWNRNITTSRRWSGDIDYVYVFSRLITEAEVREWMRDEYQILRPQTAPTYFGTPPVPPAPRYFMRSQWRKLKQYFLTR